MSIGIKVSKTGHDVLKTEDKNLSFSSKYNMFKVFMAGEVELHLPGNPDSPWYQEDEIEIAHNLGYRPAFFLWGDNYKREDWSGGEYAQGINRLPNNKAASFECIYGISKENSLIIKIVDNYFGAEKHFKVKYFIMLESIDG